MTRFLEDVGGAAEVGRAHEDIVRLERRDDEGRQVRLQPGSELPEWVDKGPFRSVTRTDHEVSVVCRDHDVPEGESVDRGWTVLEVMGPLDFSLTGVIGIDLPARWTRCWSKGGTSWGIG